MSGNASRTPWQFFSVEQTARLATGTDADRQQLIAQIVYQLRMQAAGLVGTPRPDDTGKKRLRQVIAIRPARTHNVSSLNSFLLR